MLPLRRAAIALLLTVDLRIERPHSAFACKSFSRVKSTETMTCQLSRTIVSFTKYHSPPAYGRNPLCLQLSVSYPTASAAFFFLLAAVSPPPSLVPPP